MNILDQPIRVDREAERISVFDGGATLDLNGNEEKRREAMRFYEQAPAAFRVLLGMGSDQFGEWHEVSCRLRANEEQRCTCGPVRTILRDAGVLP